MLQSPSTCSILLWPNFCGKFSHLIEAGARLRTDRGAPRASLDQMLQIFGRTDGKFLSRKFPDGQMDGGTGKKQQQKYLLIWALLFCRAVIGLYTDHPARQAGTDVWGTSFWALGAEWFPGLHWAPLGGLWGSHMGPHGVCIIFCISMY